MKPVKQLINKIYNKISWWTFRLRRDVTLPYLLKSTPKVVNIKGVKLPVFKDKLSERVLKFLLLGNYEQDEFYLVKYCLGKDDIVMELGAGLGFLSTYCAQRIGSERVFPYEANPDLKNYIHETYKINKVNPNLSMCLLGEKQGKKSFFISKNTSSSSIVFMDNSDYLVEVPVKVFDQEVQKISPTLLIVDIEGGEYELFESVNFHTIKKIVIEMHPHIIGKEKHASTLSKFKDAGFVVNQEKSYKRWLLLER